MKLKLSIFLTILVFSISALAQKTEPAKAAEVKPAPAAKLPTVKEVLDKYVAAIGGKTAVEKLKNRSTKGTVELSPMGIKGTTESYAAAPNKTYSKLSLSGIGEIVESFDGKTAWTINPIQGNRDKDGEELNQTKIVADFYREINLDKLYSKIEVKGTDKVGDKDVYVLTANAGTLPAETWYFDTKSGLLLRTDTTIVAPEGNMPAKVFYEDFREIDGVKMAHKVRSVLPQFEVITIITEIKHGVTIADSLFTKPKQ